MCIHQHSLVEVLEGSVDFPANPLFALLAQASHVNLNNLERVDDIIKIISQKILYASRQISEDMNELQSDLEFHNSPNPCCPINIKQLKELQDMSKRSERQSAQEGSLCAVQRDAPDLPSILGGYQARGTMRCCIHPAVGQVWQQWSPAPCVGFRWEGLVIQLQCCASIARLWAIMPTNALLLGCGRLDLLFVHGTFSSLPPDLLSQIFCS